MNRQKDITISKLLQIIFSVTLVVVLLFVVTAYYGYTVKLLNKNIETSLRDFAIAAQYIIDGDKHESIKSADSEAFLQLCNELAKYKQDVGVYDVYTIVRGDETHTKLFLAAYDAKSTFLREYLYTDEMKRAFDGEVVITDTPYTDDFGTFYSGYAPLYNSKGEIVAIVAVDMKADSVKALRNDVIQKAVLIFGMCFIVGNIFVYLFSIQLGKGFKSMTLRLRKIGTGDLTAEDESKFPMITEMKALESTIIQMQNDIRELISIVQMSSKELKERTDHFFEVIVGTETSSQFMESTVEEMVKTHEAVSKLFNQGLTQLIQYKACSDESFEEFKMILQSVENTKNILEKLLLVMKEMSFTPDMQTEISLRTNMLYIEYDVFNEAVMKQADLIGDLGERRESLLLINQKISDRMDMINEGNHLVSSSMKRQVEIIQDSVRDVERMRELAEELDLKIQNLKTH